MSPHNDFLTPCTVYGIKDIQRFTVLLQDVGARKTTHYMYRMVICVLVVATVLSGIRGIRKRHGHVMGQACVFYV